MGFMNKFSNVVQGLSGNLSEVSVDELNKEFGCYLTEDETIQVGFKLIRDVVIFTDRRMIEFDKQGATGQKVRVNSIFLNTIVNVSVETAGFGIDDSELEITYITSPYFKASGGITLTQKKFEFPKKYNIRELYRMLMQIALENHSKLNS